MSEAKTATKKTTKVPEVEEASNATDAGSSETAEGMKFKSSGKQQERVTLFTIDDEEFTIPKKPGTRVTVRFMNELRKSGNDMFAALGLLEDLLGEEKYNTFLDWEDLDDEILGQIVEKVVEVALGSAENATGK